MTTLPAHLRDVASIAADTQAIVIADGEHYPPVVIDAIADLEQVGWKIVGVALVGGSEKLVSEPDYGVPHVRGEDPVETVLGALKTFGRSWVIDVSDEPALVFENRARVIGAVAAHGNGYVGADAYVPSPVFTTCATPSLAVIGTGKRIGKTAIAGHLARVMKSSASGEVVVVAMGRGGPSEPVLIPGGDGVITVERLLEISRSGQHAASDYLEDAALTGCTTIGCRRGGGGLLGAPMISNVPTGARMAEAAGAALTIFEGSGSCVPPVRCDRTMLIASTGRLRDLFDDFGSYRMGLAQMVLVVGDDALVGNEAVARIRREYPDKIAHAVTLRPAAMESLAGRKIAIFTTAPPQTRSMYESFAADCEANLVAVSHSLAHRPTLQLDVAAAISGGADTFVVEVKAAAIDVVAEAAEAANIPVVLLDNRPICHDSSVDVDKVFQEFAKL